MSDPELLMELFAAASAKRDFWTWDYFAECEAVHLISLAVAVLVMGALFVLIMNAYIQRSDAPVPRRMWLLPIGLAVAAFLLAWGADWLAVCGDYDRVMALAVEKGVYPA